MWGAGSAQLLQRRMLQHWVGVLLFAALGVACRQMPTVRCKDGEEMSRRCLFNLQTGLFIVLYVLHFVAATWVVMQWLYDGLSIWGWAGQTCRGVSLAPFGVSGSTRRALRICYGDRSGKLFDQRQGDGSSHGKAMEVATAFGVTIVSLVRHCYCMLHTCLSS